MNVVELKSELSGYTGSEHYYNDFLGLLLTDGIKALQGLAKCGWLISDIAVIAKMNLKEEEFLAITIKVKSMKAVVTYDDGNGNILFTQEYGYTDFLEGELKLFCSQGVLMLPSEY